MAKAILLNGPVQCQTLNDRSAEQETVGMTLRMTTTFPNFQGLFSRKNWIKE